MDVLHVTQSEWLIMELLWDRPRTLMELVSQLQQTTDWSKSTITTMVRRMTDKGLLTYDTQGRAKCFRPAVSRRDVVAQETQSLLHRAYRDSVGLMMSGLIRDHKLTRADIDALRTILDEAEVQES